jgi:NAD(P)-dependent dehydrogenase (short-subunit alcohol dehydrogenase family)
MSASNDILREGNTAVITGASSGIGRAAALDFASRGMNIWMIDIDQEELDAALELVKQKCSKSMTQQVRRLVESTYLLYSFSLLSS